MRPDPSSSTPGLATLAGPAFLAEASRLLASSLDYETTLATVAALALPHLGAWCIVDVVEEDGRMRRLAIVHPDPAMHALVRRLERGWPPRVDDPLGIPAVVGTRRAEVIADVTDDLLREAAHDEENLALLSELGIGSLVMVPLIARGHVHGAMTFVSPRDGRRHGPDDLALAEDLAARAAMAIDNARLYREAQRARAGALEASRAKSEFLATMSHELRTPLNAITGYAELLQMELAGPLTEEQREHLERVRASSRHLLALVDEVLDLARIEAGQLPVARERGSAQTLVEEVVARCQGAARAGRVTLHDDCAAGRDPRFVGDVGRAGQVLGALVSNAVKFTPPGGRVRVGCRESAEGPAPGGERGWVAVEVEDTGVGIAPERLGHVFEPFVQERGGHTRPEEGPGLGLTVARQLARLMGGEVTAASRPGEGSCFTLWLPAASEQRSRPRRARPREGSRDALAAAGRALSSGLDAVIAAYVARLRGDAALPRAAGATELDLADHAGTLLADVAQSLAVLGGPSGDAARLMRDGSRIQRLLAELHAEQRRRLGWGEEALRRDYEILREEAGRALRASLGERAAEGAATAARLLRQSERISLHALRAAAPAAGGEGTRDGAGVTGGRAGSSDGGRERDGAGDPGEAR